MSVGPADLSERALSVLVKEVNKRGLRLYESAPDFYRAHVRLVLQEDFSLFKSYQDSPATLEDDIKAFVSNLEKARRESEVRAPLVDIEQLKLAFGRCGPHRIRC